MPLDQRGQPVDPKLKIRVAAGDIAPVCSGKIVQHDHNTRSTVQYPHRCKCLPQYLQYGFLQQSVRRSQLWAVLYPQIHCSVDVHSPVPETAASASSNISSPKCHFPDTMSVLSSHCFGRQRFIYSTAPAGSAWICFASFAPFLSTSRCTKCLPCSLRETFGVWDIIFIRLACRTRCGEI